MVDHVVAPAPETPRGAGPALLLFQEPPQGVQQRDYRRASAVQVIALDFEERGDELDGPGCGLRDCGEHLIKCCAVGLGRYFLLALARPYPAVAFRLAERSPQARRLSAAIVRIGSLSFMTSASAAEADSTHAGRL